MDLAPVWVNAPAHTRALTLTGDLLKLNYRACVADDGQCRRLAGIAKYQTSVCTGALILGAAGLLRGKRATTYWADRNKALRKAMHRFGDLEREDADLLPALHQALLPICSPFVRYRTEWTIQAGAASLGGNNAQCVSVIELPLHKPASSSI